MPDPPPFSDSDRETSERTGGRPDDAIKPGIPRWVKVFGVIALLLLVLVIVMLVAGGGKHGPARHSGSGDSGSQSAPSGVRESGGEGKHKPPPGGHKP